jgi:hypothetical protein
MSLPMNANNASSSGDLPEDMRTILFADSTLAELQTIVKGEPKNQNDWLALLRKAYNASLIGDQTTAIDSLTRILQQRNTETRLQLWAWNALRDLGKLPAQSEEKIVRGVVLEIPANGALDTMAVYADGRVRYYNGKLGLSGGVIWEAPGTNPVIDGLVTEIMQAAAPLFVLNPNRVRKHLPMNRQNYRVTLLTFGGLYVIEAPDTRQFPALVGAGARLLAALTLLTQKRNKAAPSTGSVWSANVPAAKTPTSGLRGRLLSLLFLLFGLAAVPFYVNTYINHLYFDSKVLVIFLLPLVYGFAGLFEPRILFTGAGNLDGKAKWLSLSLIVVVIAAWLGLTKVLNDSYAVMHPSQGITVENNEAFNAIAAKLDPYMETWRKTATNEPQSVSPADVGLSGTGIKSIVYGHCASNGFYVFLLKNTGGVTAASASPNAYNFSTDSDHFNAYGEGCTPKGWFVLRKTKLGNGWWASVAIP